MKRRSIVLDGRMREPVNARGLITEPVVAVDDNASGDAVTLTYVGDGVWSLFIPDGSGGHATQADGPTYKWPMRSWADGRAFTWADRFHGQLQFRLEFITDPATLAGTDVQVTLGHMGAGDLAATSGMLGGIACEATVEVCGFRNIAGSLTDSTRDASPSGDAAQAVWYGNIAMTTAGVRIGNSVCAGLDIDGAAPTPNTDAVTVSGSIDPEDFVALNVFCPTAIVGDQTILIRPRAWASAHDLA